MTVHRFDPTGTHLTEQDQDALTDISVGKRVLPKMSERLEQLGLIAQSLGRQGRRK
jgi:hypothetical protein